MQAEADRTAWVPVAQVAERLSGGSGAVALKMSHGSADPVETQSAVALSAA